MKSLIAILASVLFTAILWSQSPEKMSYQAVIRDAKNNLVTDTNIGMQISILQESESDEAVYVETQTPTTNPNGLISIEIGSGTVVSGDFTTIDWAQGPYFIKTEIDPTGDTNYTIISTSQLLSVPYALHAKTAESVSEEFVETDPVFTAWDKNYYDFINQPTIDGSETKVKAGINVIVTGDGTKSSPYVINSSAHYIGELYGGGVVFWIDNTGQHGLVVSMIDIGKYQTTWSNVYYSLAGTTNSWDGVTNTSAIIEQSGHKSSAAKLCLNYTNADYGTGVYSDWYLPSIAELNHLRNNYYEVQKTLINEADPKITPIASDYYWSSSEAGSDSAYSITFGYGDGSSYKTRDYYVRAIRAF